jgi:hypothetical protein
VAAEHERRFEVRLAVGAHALAVAQKPEDDVVAGAVGDVQRPRLLPRVRFKQAQKPPQVRHHLRHTQTPTTTTTKAERLKKKGVRAKGKRGSRSRCIRGRLPRRAY